MKKLSLIIPLIVFCRETAKAQESFLIAYNVAVKDSTGKSNYEIFMMESDGSKKKNITNNPDVAWIYTAYNKTLFFISDRDTCYRCFFLYSMDADGKNIRKISGLQLEDSWMSHRNDGREWVVTGRRGSALRFQLFIINSETGEYRQLTNDTTAMFRDPVFSPDGKQIAYVYKKNKRDGQTPEEVYIMSADGGSMKQLSHYPTNDISRNVPGYKAGALRWHPTENYISYISMQGGGHHIFAVSPTDGKQWQITRTATNEGWHDWSRDGKWLVFDQSDPKGNQYHIMLMNLKTKETTKLTDDSHKYHQCPVFVTR